MVEKADIEVDDKLNDTLGALFSLTYNFFGLFAPIIGGFLYDNLSPNSDISYRKTMDVNMIFELCMAIIFFVFNCGFKVF